MKLITLRSTVCLGLVLLSTAALAKRRNPLEGQPAIRHRHEVRAGRFELGPSFAFSFDRSLRQAITFGLKLEYHINDWLSLGADFGYGVSYDTGLTKEIEKQCDGTCPGPASNPNSDSDDQPWSAHTDRFSNIQFAGDVRGVWTPMSGKIGIFSKLFVAYDFYVFAGVGMAMLANNYDAGGSDADKVSEGFRVGPAFGFGLHLFFTKWFSIGAEIKDIAFMDNEPGGDQTRGVSETELAAGGTKLVDGDDQQFFNHWFGGIHFTFFLPTEIKISR